MKIKKEIVYLLLVILLAGGLRFYRLGSYPPIFNDEIAVGYNAWSILKTGRDEFGVKFPIFFRSFGEGKLPLYIYEAVIPIAIFGLNEFSCRFMPAFLGTLTVWILYYFVKEVLELSKVKDKNLHKYLPILSSFFLATMPWHIHFSRGVFGQESLFWVLLGSYFSLKFLNKDKNKYWIYSLISFSVSMMTYHAPKAFVPLWIAYILIFVWKKENFKKAFRLGLIALLISGSVWLWMSSSELGNARAKDMSVFSKHSGVDAMLWEAKVEASGQNVLLTRLFNNKIEAFSRNIGSKYFAHFTPDFLFFAGDVIRPRYQVPKNGLLLYLCFPIFFLGIYTLINKKIGSICFFFIISPIPAALSFESPSSVRAIFMTVPIAIILALGLIKIANKFQARWFYIILIFLFLFNLGYYLNAYYLHLDVRFGYAWQQGYKELVENVTERMESGKYDKAKISLKRGTPYMFFLFYNKYNPERWQEQSTNLLTKDKDFNFINVGKMDDLFFIDEECPIGDNFEGRTLYVCTKKMDLGEINILNEIKYRNGEIAFIILDKK